MLGPLPQTIFLLYEYMSVDYDVLNATISVVDVSKAHRDLQRKIAINFQLDQLL